MSRHWKISTGRHFQNGHHNTAQIQHCSISRVAFDLFFKPVVSGQFGRIKSNYYTITTTTTPIFLFMDCSMKDSN